MYCFLCIHPYSVQNYVTSFLFDEGKQAVRVLLSSQGSAVDIQNGANLTLDPFPCARRFADMDLLFQFKPSSEKVGMNEFRMGVGVIGFPPIEVIACKLRKVISLCTDGGKAQEYPKQMTNGLIEAFLQLFPNGHQFISGLFDTETFTWSMTPKGYGIFTEMDADVNIEKLEKLYPSVANWLRHLQEIDIVLLDIHPPGTAPEEKLEDAKCFGKLRIYYRDGWVGFHLCLMLSASESGKLLWFNQSTNGCATNLKGEVLGVDFN